jgi:hypothetical protein
MSVVPLRKYNCPDRATYTRWYFCDHCENIHIALKDKDDKIYTEAVMSDAMVLGLVAALLERRGVSEEK